MCALANLSRYRDALLEGLALEALRPFYTALDAGSDVRPFDAWCGFDAAFDAWCGFDAAFDARRGFDAAFDMRRNVRAFESRRTVRASCGRIVGVRGGRNGCAKERCSCYRRGEDLLGVSYSYGAHCCCFFPHSACCLAGP